jgi:hypothetical protein
LRIYFSSFRPENFQSLGVDSKLILAALLAEGHRVFDGMPFEFVAALCDHRILAELPSSALTERRYNTRTL